MIYVHLEIQTIGPFDVHFRLGFSENQINTIKHNKSAECYVAPALSLPIRNSMKHQYDTYFGKIHRVVHEILSVLYFRYFSKAEAATFE